MRALLHNIIAKALPLLGGVGGGLFLLAACTGDDEWGVPAVRESAIIFGSAAKGDVLWANGRTPRGSGDRIDGEMPANIGVFAFGDKQVTAVFDNQKVLFIDSVEYKGENGTPLFDWDYWDASDPQNQISRWPYTITPGASKQELWLKMKYRFLAYSPWTADGVSVAESGYNFSTFTWTGIPEYSDRDYLIAKEIVPVDNSQGTRMKDELVTFEMQHLMARIRFLFKVGAEYRTIRSIELKSIDVQTAGKQKDATFTFTEGASAPSITWGSERIGAPTSVTLTSASTYEIPTAYDAPFASLYVWPQDGFSELTLTLKYAVFDSEHVKTRDAEITNTVTISPIWDLFPGRYYDVKINIVPDFLYVLSDNDQDFDGWVIIKESPEASMLRGLETLEGRSCEASGLRNNLEQWQ